jgi:cyclic pyranopterin phosphate synthase
VLVDEKGRREIKGREGKTTNNRMELMAAIKGLAETAPGSRVTVETDSQYLVNTMTKNWKRRANRDLWKELDRLAAERTVSWSWLKGHDGHPENELANSLANEMARGGGNPGPTHFDAAGDVHMVDVTAKSTTEREAVAKGSVAMKPGTLAAIRQGETAKGNVLAVAQMAGIMAAKQAHQLIPLCHPLPIASVDVKLEPDEKRSAVDITAVVKATAQTGVEMEALTAVSVSALTVYDMCKAMDRGMRIGDIRLVTKRGGKSGEIVLE